jgi:hypothetical protein
MKACLSLSDLVELGQRQTAELQRVADMFPSAQAPGASEAFTRQVRLEQGMVEQTYALTATLARKTEDLTEVAEIWGKMSDLCDSVLQRLAVLKDKYPDSGTAELYDLVLDYKLAADKRRHGTLQEVTCQRRDFPKGLLPDLS